MLAKKSVLIGLAAAVAVIIASCGGEEPEVVTGEEASGLGTVFKDMRRNTELGEGGWFKFTFESVEYPTEWGYADFHPTSAQVKSRLVLLNNPIGGDQFPLLRLVVFSQVANAADLLGQTLEDQMISLKMEKKKGKGLEGTASVTFTAVDESWLEGNFSGSVVGDGETKEVTGSFKVRLNTPEELQ